MARILIVDDEETVREIIKEALLPGGHELYLAAGGAPAFEILRKKRLDLLIVDRNMPGMTGIEIVQLVRMNPKTASLKILMCTGASVTKEIDEAFAAGADDYIIKPFDFALLVAKVAKIIALPSRPA